MATQQDLQELLRLLTASRKVPMLQAMTQIKALQAVDLRSIKQIAESPLKIVESALKDDKAARSLQSACKAVLKRGDGGATATTGKRPAASSLASPAQKRAKFDSNHLMGAPTEMTPQELERSLELPLCTDEDRIAATVVQTNRAPLVLAFAVELIRHTMPEQPLSSRLSLGQAIVSANSRSKAVSIGLDKGPSADEEGWGEGQPRVRVLGREVAVLKRGGYEWQEEEEEEEEAGSSGGLDESQTQTLTQTQTQSQAYINSSLSSTMIPETQHPPSTTTTQPFSTMPDTQTQSPSTTMSNTQSQSPSYAPTLPTQATATTWHTGSPLTLKSSTFLAHVTTIRDRLHRASLIESLFAANPRLRSATHNAWAYRIAPPPGFLTGLPREEAFDDGETGCGDLMLRVMREVKAVDTLVGRGGDGGKGRGGLGLGGVAVWGLDLEGTRRGAGGGGGGGGGKQHTTGVVGMQIHRPETARGYLLKSFLLAETGTSTGGKAQKKTQKMLEAEREENLGLVLGALRLVFESWAGHLTAAELDRRAWAWYVAVRPDVESGAAGWGAKAALPLRKILDLRRKEQ
ncbi:hypothetical protein B0T17DRAFT_633136 [Bombardia bombarda]|uniref:Impact N-terminal domain-containing protein n=1 Tax=Bombardia bombarda TaxID=252184 RepID=A0AA39X804_9PEZI|nr:hypothetical protein B0T17DRAFT_633136 [Bombardia bombarda]